MLLFAAAYLATATLADEPRGSRNPAASVRATAYATVRLVKGEIVRFGEDAAANSRERVTTIRLADGEHEAKIVEFE